MSRKHLQGKPQPAPRRKLTAQDGLKRVLRLWSASAGDIRGQWKTALAMYLILIAPSLLEGLIMRLTGWQAEVNTGNGFWVTQWHYPDWVSAVPYALMLLRLWLLQAVICRIRALTAGREGSLRWAFRETFGRAPGFLLTDLAITGIATAAALAGVLLALALSLIFGYSDALIWIVLFAAIGFILWMTRLEAARYLWADEDRPKASACLKEANRLTRRAGLSACLANRLITFVFTILAVMLVWGNPAVQLFAASGPGRALLGMLLTICHLFEMYVHGETLKELQPQG